MKFMTHINVKLKFPHMAQTFLKIFGRDIGVKLKIAFLVESTIQVIVASRLALKVLLPWQ